MEPPSVRSRQRRPTGLIQIEPARGHRLPLVFNWTPVMLVLSSFRLLLAAVGRFMMTQAAESSHPLPHQEGSHGNLREETLRLEASANDAATAEL